MADGGPVIDDGSMDESTSRRALKAEFRERRPDAGVYRILNARTGRSLIGTTTNIRAMRNRVAFAKSTQSVGGMDGRLAADLRKHGFDAFSFEVLETVPVAPEKSRESLTSDLEVLEGLWREKFAGEPHY